MASATIVPNRIGFILFAILLADRLCITFLVHVTIVGILSAQPLQFEPDVVFAASRIRVAQFSDIATAGAISVLVSCVLLWQVSVWWRSAGRRRLCLGVLLAASLTGMILLAARIVMVEIPTISPVLAANIPVPPPFRLIAAAVLALVLVTAAARRWSEPPSAGLAPRRGSWRRDEMRYHHECRVLMFILGSIALAECVAMGWQLYSDFSWFGSGWDIGYLVASPVGCLSLALALLAARGVLSGWSKRPSVIAAEQPRLTPAVFLFVWAAPSTIVLGSAPIFGAWGFFLLLGLGH